MLNVKKIWPVLLAAVIFFSSCKKDGFGPLTDNRPDIPVTVSNVFDYRPNPTVKASKTDGKITITMEIPASSGRTIKEITKVSATATGNFSVIRDSTKINANGSGLYTAAAIPGGGTSVTFTTTLDEYRAKTSTTSTPIAVPASNALLSRAFYFLLTLDNGEQIYPQFVRVWLVD